MVHKNTNIPIIVTANRPETPSYRSLLFERPPNFTYESGDWIEIAFPGQNVRGGAVYSLSSAPTEPYLMITFKDGFSEFKKALAAAKPGDSVIIAHYGNDYKFTLNPHKTSTLIAGGVGIAPFRSMLQEMVDTADNNSVHLLYLNQTAQYLFEPELQAWAQQLAGLKITYFVTKDVKRKERTKAMLAAIQSPDQSFYIAGPEGMVESTEHMLLDFGVALSDIKIDSFGGY